jgi:hypothetical protein
MNVAATEVLSPVEIVFAYHARTKHTLQRYAAGPEALDVQRAASLESTSTIEMTTARQP